MNKTAFITLIAAGAQESMRATGVPASFTIAQAALESAWGESGLTKSAMNLFGIKADKGWKGPTVTIPTREYVDGKWVTVPALWRKYLSWAECLTDHAQFFIVNKRYAPAFKHTDNAEQFAIAIADAGYATDPQYSAKVIATIRSNNLTTFDKLEKKA